MDDWLPEEPLHYGILICFVSNFERTGCGIVVTHWFTRGLTTYQQNIGVFGVSSEHVIDEYLGKCSLPL